MRFGFFVVQQNMEQINARLKLLSSLSQLSEFKEFIMACFEDKNSLILFHANLISNVWVDVRLWCTYVGENLSGQEQQWEINK